MSLDKKKKLKKSDLTITVLLVIGILAVVNFFSYQMFTRWDLTENRVYSISDVSKKTVKNLDDVVNIKAYFSDNLPNQFLSLKQEVNDILDEYEAFSDGNVNIEFIDPGDDDATKQKLYMKGIPQLTFQVLEKDKAQVVNGYMGITIDFGDKTETIPVVKQDTRDLEYQITTAIKKVISDEIAAIGILTSQGTLVQEQMSDALQKLQEIYTLEPVDLSTTNEIPATINTLIIAGPREEFTDEQLQSINSFLVAGGKALVLLDGVIIEQGLQATPNATGLDTLLEKYGVTVNRDLLADTRNAMASFNQGFFTFSTNYPFWLRITNDGFNQDNSAVSSLEDVVMQWASSLNVKDSEAIQVLAQTSNQAWSQTDNFNIIPGQTSLPSGNQKYNLAVMVNGEVDNPYPTDDQTKFPLHLIVVGDSDFIANGSNNDNLNLFQNLVDTLSLGDDLIGIRSKNVISRPIDDDLSDSKRQSIRYFNIFGITVIVVIFGLVRYYLRRKSRFVDDL